MNPFTCGTIQTGVTGMLYSIPFPITSLLVWNPLSVSNSHSADISNQSISEADELSEWVKCFIVIILTQCINMMKLKVLHQCFTKHSNFFRKLVQIFFLLFFKITCFTSGYIKRGGLCKLRQALFFKPKNFCFFLGSHSYLNLGGFSYCSNLS